MPDKYVQVDTSGQVTFHNLTRAEFDAFPGDRGHHFPATADCGEFWSKALLLRNEKRDDVRIVYFTSEAPAEVVIAEEKEAAA